MNRVSLGLAAITLAGAAGTCALAASPGAKEVAAARADGELAQPAPVPGTFDFQLARLTAGASAHEGASAPAVAFDPARPDVAVARRFVDAAWAFESYTRKAGALDGAFADGAGVSRAVAASAAYEPSQLGEGAIAWGALAALQDVGFVDAVRQAAPDAASREALAAELLARPAAVLRLPGAREAALRVSDLVGRRGAALIAAGASVNAASYTVQKSAWSKTSLDKPADRLAAVKTLGARRATAGPSDTAELMAGLTALRPAAAQSRALPQNWRPTPAVARSVALAALALVGRAGEDHAAEAAPLLATAQGDDCLKMAKLNLHQCLAVAGPRYEDMFCLGRHAVADTGQCLVSTAGWTPPPPAAPRLIAAVAPAGGPAAAAPVAVPIALAALDGPERAAVFAPPPPPAPPPAPPQVEAAASVALPAASEFARAAAAPSPEEDAPPRPRWSRPVAVDDDEAQVAPQRRPALRPAPRPEPRLAAEDDGRADAEDDAAAARAPRLDDRRRYAAEREPRRYAADDRSDDRYDDRYTRRAADRDDDEDAPPPRSAASRWSAPPPPGYGGPGYGAPGYGAYGYGGYGSYGYGPGSR